jgi:glutamyl-tRNA synthetase
MSSPIRTPIRTKGVAVRTRFAPSPTGFLHIGVARTGLFNWAFARHHGGSMVLRIEDTDLERSTEESERQLLEGLTWLGVDWDEGPYKQTQRSERHQEVVAGLLASGNAYRCSCTREELEARRKQTIEAGEKWTYDGRCRDLDLGAGCGEHTVRLRLPESGPLAWDDLVFGPSGQDAREIGDRIIQRADGTALYHLAVVVDDLDMQISHVIRGADHMPNTPFHIALYRALKAPPPAFAHVPLILAESGKKLSKRRDPVSIQQFRDAGIVADALRNWIVRLGWSHGDQEIFSKSEIEELFDLDGVGRSAARMDTDKLAWLNHHYIQTLPRDELLDLLDPCLEEAVGHPFERSDSLAGLVDLNRQRGKTLIELATHTAWLVRDRVHFDEKAARKNLTPEAGELLVDLGKRLAAVAQWDAEHLAAVFEQICSERDLKMGKLAQPVRVALTGGTISPGIYETLDVVGRSESLARLAAAADRAVNGEFAA